MATIFNYCQCVYLICWISRPLTITSFWRYTVAHTKTWSGMELGSGIFNVYIFMRLIILGCFYIVFSARKSLRHNIYTIKWQMLCHFMNLEIKTNDVLRTESFSIYLDVINVNIIYIESILLYSFYGNNRVNLSEIML